MTRWEAFFIACIPVAIVGALYFVATHWNG